MSRTLRNSALALAFTLTGCTNLTGGLSTVPPATTSGTASAKASVQQLQILAALGAALKAQAGGAQMSSKVGGQGTGSHYAISSVATHSFSVLPTGWSDQNNGTTVSFAITDAWYEDGGSVNTYVGVRTTTDSASNVLETVPTLYTFNHTAPSGWDHGWQGTDELTEQVTSSSLREAGRYVTDRDEIRVTADGVNTDDSTQSVSFTPADGGATRVIHTLRHGAWSDDHSMDREDNHHTGTLSGGHSFEVTSSSQNGNGRIRFLSASTIRLVDGRTVNARLDVAGDGQGDPTTLDATSSLVVGVQDAGGHAAVTLTVDQLVVHTVGVDVQATGVVTDATGTQIADFAGTFAYKANTFRGRLTYLDGTTEDLNLDAVAQSLM